MERPYETKLKTDPLLDALHYSRFAAFHRRGAGLLLEGRMNIYTVVTRDRTDICGHKHRTLAAAKKCRIKFADAAKWHNAEVLKNGEGQNGIGLYPDGEPAYL